MQDRPSPTGQPDRLDAQALRAALLDPASAGPVSLEVAWSVDSTNAELWRRSPVPGWEILLAEQQTAGRGRLGRSWVSPLSSQVCMSLRGRFAGGLAQLEGLSLVAGVALSEALHGLGFRQVGLKWPNDVLADGCKLAGVLVECRGERDGPVQVVVGIGVNVSLPQITSLAIDQPWTDLARLAADGAPPSRNAVAIAVLQHLLEALACFEREGLAPFLARYAALDLLAGRQVRVLAGRRIVEGLALGLAGDGGLRVATEVGEQVFHGGEVSVRAR